MGALFFALPAYEANLLVWKKMPAALPQIAAVLGNVAKALEKVPPDRFVREDLTNAVAASMEGRERGEILWPLRVSLSGQASSPDPIDIMIVLGKEESLRRIREAIGKCMA